MARLFHIVDPAVWAGVESEYRPESLANEGFVHLSYADQVQGVANDRYRDAAALQVLEIDPGRLTDPIKVEDSYGKGIAFPHLYGPLPVAAVIAIHPLPRDRHETFTFAVDDPA